MIIINDELGRMWKEEGVVYFEILFRNLPVAAGETHQKTQ
jgi:hypothetical protein